MTDIELTKRLETLERDNRRLKRLAAAGFALVAALGVIYAASCTSLRRMSEARSISQKITAHEFDVVDGTGKVRVKVAVNCLTATTCSPGISLFDPNGKALTTIGAGMLTISGEGGEASVLDDRIQFARFHKGAKPDVTARLGSGSGGGSLSLLGNGTNYALVNADPPGVEIQDAKGYTMNLGAVNLTTVSTGVTSQTSADSIVMFGNDAKHHLIWRAP